MSNRICITGASGFLGAHLCLHFAKKGYAVTAIEGGSQKRSWRLEYVWSQVPRGSLEIEKVDLTEISCVRSLVKKIRPTYAVNCAAYGGYASQKDIERIYAVNFTAARYLLEACRDSEGFEAFIQAGSSSEYGKNSAAPLENAPSLPDSDYAVSKLGATHAAQFYATQGLPAWIFRLYAVYGPLEDSSRLIPKALRLSLEGKLPPLVNPKVSRDFIHVDDVCAAFESLLDHRSKLTQGEIFNIGTGTKTTMEDLVGVLRSRLGVRETPSWGSMPDRAWDNLDWYSNPSKALTQFGWKSKIDLARGLEMTRYWLKNHPEIAAQAAENSVLAP